MEVGNKKKIGITGGKGFIGSFFSNTLRLQPEKYQIISFERSFFDEPSAMDDFVSQCDVIVHLAGMNRHNDPEVIYQTNTILTRKLLDSLNRADKKPHVLFSSSLQEEKDNLYGKSKREARLLLKEWADATGAKFSGLVIPNVFGPFGNPYYNSVIATFCYQVARNEIPRIEVDSELRLIYVGELITRILEIIDQGYSDAEMHIPHTSISKVSKILAYLNEYKTVYSDKGNIPVLSSKFEINLFNTYRCYEDIRNKFPVKLEQHIDQRGAFSEIIRLANGGQVSFSTTHPGITRGNHFHTRKIERFAVIQGDALIQLRKTGTNEVLDFYLSDNRPAFVDMPIWYTHNIKNIGTKELITIFWINESYDASDPDTYFEIV